jgi:BirA family biotin operon repressor/biotin-[acetyl-CoA-carboxylase] ligase
VRDQKIGGILLQNGISGNRFRYCIAGIGLNINEKIFPKEVPNPTSLFLETGIHHPPEDLLEQLCLTLEKRYLQLKAGKREALQQAYLDHLYKYQEESWFQETGGKPFRAMITGVNTDGKLEVTLSTGEKRTYSNKEVIYM